MNRLAPVLKGIIPKPALSSAGREPAPSEAEGDRRGIFQTWPLL